VDRRIRRGVAGMCAVLEVLLPVASHAAARSTRVGVTPADARAIDALFAPYRGHNTPGAAVAVVDRGHVVFVRGYGLANLETKRPITDRTNFRLASLTKAFTATAILLLVNDGLLRLDDHVREILPDFPSYGSAIRIRHLLTHTSGLDAYEGFIAPGQRGPVRDHDVLGLLRRADRLLFPPGSAFRYGDSGYAVLGLVVEAVSGRPFARFLKDRIFARAGMSSTSAWAPGGDELPNRAIGYAASSDRFREADHSVTSGVLADGGVYSSVHDLIAWDRALDQHRLVPEPLQTLAWTPATLADGAATHYGFGWYLDRDALGTYAHHRGETTGFTHCIIKYPSRRLTVIVLTNRRGGAPDDIASTITRLASFRRADG
jgi:CubicO group peptidase (beta-lactamase class C family)